MPIYVLSKICVAYRVQTAAEHLKGCKQNFENKNKKGLSLKNRSSVLISASNSQQSQCQFVYCDLQHFRTISLSDFIRFCFEMKGRSTQANSNFYLTNTRSLIVLLVVLLHSGAGTSTDVCELLYETTHNDKVSSEAAAEELRRHIFHAHLPKAGPKAGKYLKVDAGETWIECVSACCDRERSCDVALFTDQKCYHLTCVTSPDDACTPVATSQRKHNSTVMVVIGDVAKSRGSETVSTSASHKLDEDLPDEDSDIEGEESPESGKSYAESDWKPHRKEGNHGTEHDDDKDDDEDGKSSDEVGDEGETDKVTPAPPDSLEEVSGKLAGEPCEFGLGECVKNAACVLRESSRSRQGHCQCEEGYHISSGGVCVSETDGKTVSSTLDDGDAETGLDGSQLNKTDAASWTTTIKPKVTKLTVSAGEHKTIQLPTNSITLTAFVLPKPRDGKTYTYVWTPVSLPENAAETATMDGKNTDTLKLSNLIAGLYVMMIKVSADDKFGQATVNVTVLPAARQNKSPHAIIQPPNQEVNLPNSAILDGSESTDDDKIVSYKWEEVSGPLQNHELNSEGQMLTLKDLAPGNYTFRLTVTDSDGASNSTSANVTIKKEKDYPPRADAGSDQVVFLPKNSLYLYGNKSSDDKGELSYEWIKTADDKLTAGMTGVRSSVLKLTNLEVGDYKFTLKVTDSSGQTDTADVHVFVKPQTNKPPVANTPGHLDLILPLESLTLDGSNSTDDLGKMSYVWVQKSGPSTLKITNHDQAVAIATGAIKAGNYEFELTVTDSSSQESTAKLTVNVKKDVKLPPKANAGGNKVVQLPVSLVTLDGSGSTDDHGISKYTWQRDSKSLAAGTILNNSDHKAVLQLVNLVAGQYQFTLTVEDADGLTSSDTASLMVSKNNHEKDTVEMILDADINHFTAANRESVESQLELMLQRASETEETTVDIHDMRADVSTGNLVLTFQVIQKGQGSMQIMKGTQALSSLQHKLDSGKILDYTIVRLDLLVCQNNCSGHGHCDQKTKKCVCEAFWMPNLFSSSVFDSQTNCEWSVLYVVIICFMILVALISAVWTIICCSPSKRCKLKLKQPKQKRHRYSLLRDAEHENGIDNIELMSKNKSQNSSVMISESELSSDEETLFISSSHKKMSNGVNGRATANGSKASGYRSKLKT